jgi:hypothetical protein
LHQFIYTYCEIAMDSRFLLENGTGIFTGNELIVKGALENRVGAITGYPGSPLA